MSNAETYFRYLVNEIHTTIVATVDDEGWTRMRTGCIS